MPEKFISEPLRPVAGSFDTTLMGRGTPGVPREFFWRKEKFLVKEITRAWRTTGPCRHESGERYTRRHWFEIKTEPPAVMKIYFDKGAPGRQKDMGWHVFSVDF